MALLDQYGLFWPTDFETTVSAWLLPIKYHEISAVIGYPTSDRQRRLLALQLTHPEFNWITIDLRTEPIHEPQELLLKLFQLANLSINQPITIDNLCKQIQQNTIICYIGAEELLLRNQTDLLLSIIQIYRYQLVGQILFFDTNIYDDRFSNIFIKIPAFQPRISYQSLYDRNNAEAFIHYLERKWDIHIPPLLIKEILKQCGGVFALIKESVWYWRDHQDACVEKILNHPQMYIILNSLWQNFSIEDQKIIKAVALETNCHNPSFASLDYLQHVNFIDKKHITVPLLTQFIQKKQSDIHHLTLHDQTIVINSIPISNQLTKHQRTILRSLLKSPGELIAREKLIELVWGNSDQGSDWALDNQITRLRKRLQSLGIDGSKLVTKRGKGFIWNG